MVTYRIAVEGRHLLWYWQGHTPYDGDWTTDEAQAKQYKTKRWAEKMMARVTRGMREDAAFWVEEIVEQEGRVP